MAITKRTVFDLIESRMYKHGDWEKVVTDIANHLKVDDREARYMVREYVERWGHYHK
jgi:hypothetical protein